MKLYLSIACLAFITGIYDLTVPGIDGSIIHLKDYKGKKVLIVNIATGSPLAAQLHSLETLYQQHKDSLVIIAVPSNSFNKEPLSNEAIHALLKEQYHVHFLVTAKSVVSGATRISLYRWLTSAASNGAVDNPVNGDFQKSLINKNGKLIGIFSAGVDPLAKELQNALANN